MKPLAASAPALAFALAAVVAPTLAAAAGPMQRPNRVTDNPTSTTNKVLVAVPTADLSAYDFLYVATEADLDAYGTPVAVDGATPFNSTLVLMSAPLLEARNGFWGRNFLRAERTGFQTYAPGSSAAEGNNTLGEEVAALRDALARPVSVHAAAGPRLKDLPAGLRGDPWALLNSGRLRDAGSVFAGLPASPQRDAGMALAAALLGKLDAAGERLDAMDAASLGDLPMMPRLVEQARGLASEAYAGRPAAAVLDAMADAAMPASADLSK
ncbi:hypothetical protein [Phycisphaera mikurensis]|uniref:Uncharacterized protein n=1 Tax=Phycisphaera mikurensis (strain NBRC 102666 / KCTC 22515 / FYK2301M01) TaxID=1142394 RepID=I0IFS5_PHYMF|nr:hypothetical protein [Phycisphaera mikurensis]MBB6440497.1 hypothetical protein [Phycisphaera mikurensis]BAM04113.1 hypothetical protein PSMK_19540 [Phycisphaera mikurensis NBRC 102666]